MVLMKAETRTIATILRHRAAYATMRRGAALAFTDATGHNPEHDQPALLRALRFSPRSSDPDASPLSGT